MIPKETIDKIFEEARIEEVVGDFVVLKKRGVNLLGCCPFHNEKTPSFTVSPAKGIYKCFGCGVAGNAVNFVMEHETMTYPEALKYLAKKYNIEIVEEEVSDEEKERMNLRESMFLITTFAEEHFRDMLLNTDEGKSVGLGYFKGRGISDEMIEKFHLGYSFEQRDHFSKIALEKGYNREHVAETGLMIDKGERFFDRFAGRVMFPIHNLSGRVIGFGGRTLSTEKKIAKYLNSPESEIYHKSKTLYGIFQAKRSIIQKDNCFLVEGYTDVISFHQREIENVVASSGTSLTTEQIKLIERFTKNVTVLYDGDAAGIKASFRGIDMILQEGLNIKVVLFPDGEDPDSFARKNNTAELEDFLDNNAQDFINFKISVLLEDAGDDPIKKAKLIKDVVHSISLIPDAIVRSVYTKEAARLLDIDEETLLSEQNKNRKEQAQKRRKREGNQNQRPPEASAPTNVPVAPDFQPPILEPIPEEFDIPPEFTPYEIVESEDVVDAKSVKKKSYNDEEELLRLLLQYGHFLLQFEKEELYDEEVDQEDTEEEEVTQDTEVNEQDGKIYLTVGQYILNDLKEEELEFSDPTHNEILSAFYHCLEQEEVPTVKYFSQSPNSKIVERVIEITNTKHKLDDWKKHNIHVTKEEDKIKLATIIHLNRFKYEKIEEEIRAIEEELSIDDRETDIDILLMRMNLLNQAKKTFSANLGRAL